MPSPIGHALAGLAAGWLIQPPDGAAERRTRLRRAALFAAAGAAPDLDLLVGAHSGPSHSIGAAVIVGVVAWLLARGGRAPARLALAVGAAYASHSLLDWLGADTSAPIGIMALWPFSQGYYESSAHVFMAISRRYWLPAFWTGNLIAIAWELLILGPPLALLVWLRRRA